MVVFGYISWQNSFKQTIATVIDTIHCYWNTHRLFDVSLHPKVELLTLKTRHHISFHCRSWEGGIPLRKDLQHKGKKNEP